MQEPVCKGCGATLNERWKKCYCSNACQIEAQYHTFISEWLAGSRTVVTKNISRHLKRFLLEEQKGVCSSCGWNKKHPLTLKVPLEVDHIDGNSSNNARKNLRLLCPNCHALTPSFRNLNKGKGRAWRNANASS